MQKGDVDQSLGDRNRGFEILCQAAVAIEPSERSFDNPAAWQQRKASRVSSAFDDLNGPFAELGEGVTQVGAVVNTIGEQVAQPGKQLVDRLDDQNRTIAILDIGGCTLAPTSRPPVSVNHRNTTCGPKSLVASMSERDSATQAI